MAILFIADKHGDGRQHFRKSFDFTNPAGKPSGIAVAVG
jgi:hypothetical protein